MNEEETTKKEGLCCITIWIVVMALSCALIAAGVMGVMVALRAIF